MSDSGSELQPEKPPIPMNKESEGRNLADQPFYHPSHAYPYGLNGRILGNYDQPMKYKSILWNERVEHPSPNKTGQSFPQSNRVRQFDDRRIKKQAFQLWKTLTVQQLILFRKAPEQLKTLIQNHFASFGGEAPHTSTTFAGEELAARMMLEVMKLIDIHFESIENVPGIFGYLDKIYHPNDLVKQFDHHAINELANLAA